MPKEKKSLLFIVNPISGAKRKDDIELLISTLLDKDLYTWRIVHSEYPGHAKELALASEEDTVVAVGGDGTVSEVASGLVGSGKTLGIIPCGSGDGLARHLGISHSPAKAIRTINSHATVRMDCGKVADRMFFCTTGVGFDADVAEAFAKSPSRGLKTYITSALSLWKDYTPDTYTITIDGETFVRKAVMITVGNASQWGNNATIAPGASVCDGLLDITIVLPFKNIEIPHLATLLLTGTLEGNHDTEMMRGKQITISRSKEGAVHSDGDPFTWGKEIPISIIPSALDVIVSTDYIDAV